jgi:serine/threonine protein phosphatase PrpC
MKLTAMGLTDPGQVRKNNEDNFFCDDGIGLLVVADGMGGHAAGEVASQLAVDVVREQVARGLSSGKIPNMGEKPLHLSDRAQLLTVAVRMANEVIYSAAQEKVERRGMGTTIVAVLVDKKSFAVAHVGDSRLYLLRDGKLSQVTRDHSLVAEQVAQGLIKAEDAEKSEIKNVLTRALGIGADVDIDVSEYPLKSGDNLLLCTDGLCRMAEDVAIEAEMNRLNEPIDICQNLVRIANERGGKDNVTVISAKAAGVSFWTKIMSMLGMGSKTPAAVGATDKNGASMQQ